MASHLISVIMPVRDGERYIEAAVRSILNQTHDDLELLVIDDSSTDNTSGVLANISDPRLRVLKNSGSGIVDGLNYGIVNARGKFLARMDADDIALPIRLATQLQALCDLPERTDIVCSNAIRIDENGLACGFESGPSIAGTSVRQALLGRAPYKPIIHPTVMMHSRVVERVGMYRHFVHAEDRDYWLRASRSCRIHRIQTPLLKYRIHSASVSLSKTVEQATGGFMAILNERIFESTGVDLFDKYRPTFEDLARLVRVKLRSSHEGLLEFQKIKNMYATRDYFSAVATAGRALMHSGLNLAPRYRQAKRDAALAQLELVAQRYLREVGLDSSDRLLNQE